MQGVRVPSQQRGQQSWEHLLNVAEELIEEVGFSGVTAAELSRRSGISNGSIFWRVGSMEALFVAVHERFLKRLVDEQRVYDDTERWADLDLEDFVAAAVRVLADIFSSHGRMVAALTARVPSDEGTATRAGEAVRGASSEFIDLVSPQLAKTGCPEPDLAAASLFQIAYGALLTRVTWHDQLTPVDVPWDRFVDDLCEMSAVYALRRTAGPSV